jgi:hydrogenase 3 maturation protease
VQSLTKELKNRLKGAKRIAILGVGSEFRADDAAGMLVAESIEKGHKKQETRNKRQETKLKVFFGATAPENLTGEIIKFKPTHIIVADTADIKEKPGTILLLKDEDLGEGVSFSTHKLPPKVMIDYLGKKLKCSIMLLGIQPKNLSFGNAVSKEIKSSVKDVSNAIMDAVKD